MLVTEIDRNLPKDPEKQLDRVYWTFRSPAVSAGGPGGSFEEQLRRKRGKIVSRGERRHNKRREPSFNKGYVRSFGEHRLKYDRRKNGSAQNEEPRDIVVIALERKPGQTDSLRVGAEVYVESAGKEPVVPPPVPRKESPQTTGPETPPATEDPDYVVHLSRPPEG